jgi:peptidoglycan/xylan/chitin deacetylase (PgdA/CDA1 family)
VRSLLKHTAERALSSPLAATFARSRVRHSCLVLAYHGIVPEGGAAVGDRSLFVHYRDFVGQVECLREMTAVVPLSDIDRDIDAGPRVAITFDDAYEGAVSDGVPALVERSLPATIFVAPGRLGGQIFWWDALARPGVALDESIRANALHRLRGADERVRSWAIEERLSMADDMPRYARSATIEQLRGAVSRPGITVASHSWSHANLAALPYAEIVGELENSRDWLQREFGEKAVPWVAYPYGLDSAEVHRAAEAAGYRGGFRIGGGWHRTPVGPGFERPRLNIPADLSLAGFKARLVGALKS